MGVKISMDAMDNIFVESGFEIYGFGYTASRPMSLIRRLTLLRFTK